MTDLKKNKYLDVSLRLQKYISNEHWDGRVIVGPDPIGKINWRVTRFVRSYIPWFPQDDRYVYLQGQAYWILGNLKLFDITNNAHYMEIAEQCGDEIVARQPVDGAWRHPPIRGRKGFISTVEGVWASLGLIALYRKSRKLHYLESALKWYHFQINQVGFQRLDQGLAANYYSHSTSMVPNVSTMLLWLAAELYSVTNDDKYLDKTSEMLNFINYTQLDTGELPYSYPDRIHFMCFQYNAFQFVDLAHYYSITENDKCLKIMKRLASFLAAGLSDKGYCRYNCSRDVPEVHYWTAALATALRMASEFKLGDYLQLSENAYQYLLTRQRSDGSFNFSEHNYVFFNDKRSYPRYLAMLLYFMLDRADVFYHQNESKTQETLLEEKG